jgi:diazepam-binding inhibitor (GABA receptor modulator, acyl-CoA-binding protein)
MSPLGNIQKRNKSSHSNRFKNVLLIYQSMDKKIKKLFEYSIETAKSLNVRPTDEELLQLYAYYKQTTIGKCNTQKPEIYDVKGRYKWDAWNKLGKLDKNQLL